MTFDIWKHSQQDSLLKGGGDHNKGMSQKASLQQAASIGPDSSTANPIFGKRLTGERQSGSPINQSNSYRSAGEVATKLSRKSIPNTSLPKPDIDRAYSCARCSDLEATERLHHAVENGSQLAQAYLSILHAKGTQHIPRDEKKATYCAQRSWAWLQTEASKGCPYSQFNIGFCLLDGRGSAKNEAEAVSCFRMAADQGHAGAQSNLAVLYQHGIGTRKNEQEAVRYYKLAADQGYAVAQCNLAVCYEQGKGVTKNAFEATKYYELSAEQGYPGGQNGMGWCYFNGIGVNKNEQEAVRYFQLAADQGHAAGQYNMGRCHKKGIALPRNLTEARSYYTLAAAQGHEDAKNKLRRMR